MQRLTLLLSLLLLLLYASDAFACGNNMGRWKEDPVVHNNMVVAWHLSRGENREALQKVAFRYRRAAIELWAKDIMAGEAFTNSKRKRVVHLTAAAVVRSQGMWARTDKAEALGEVEARANLEWAVAVLEVLADDSAEARAYLVEGRYRLNGDAASAGRDLTAIAASNELPDGVSYQLLAELTADPALAGELEKKAIAMRTAAAESKRPRNSREPTFRRGADGVLVLF